MRKVRASNGSSGGLWPSQTEIDCQCCMGAEEAGDELESDAEANEQLQQRRQRFWWTSTTLDEIVDFVQANRAEIADLKKKKQVPRESRCPAVSGLIFGFSWHSLCHLQVSR